MSSSGGARPLALCVGMGVAMLASVQLTKHNRKLWKSLQAMHKSTAANATARTSLLRRRVGGTQAGALDDAHPRLLTCVQQLSEVEKNRLSNERITVVQFNILARNLATRNHFPYVVDSSLNWDYRKTTLLRQLDELDADVVCLEELSDYWTFFKPELHERGYDSVYIKRPSIHVSNWSGEKKHDGCGIFYKKDKFELKECETINFHDSHDRVAVLALLKLRHFAQFVMIGCTHLWWNPKKVDHQMAEIFELEEEIIRMSSDIRDKYERDLAQTHSGPHHVPVIICGDFNNSPESPLYEYMENSFMQKPNLEGVQDVFRSAYGRYKQNAQSSPYHDAESSLELGLQHEEGKKDEPPHTTVNFRRCWTIDYVWYSQNTLVPTRILDIPSEAALRSEEGPADWFNRLAMLDSYSKSGRLPTGFQGNHNGIPNSQFGSDHVPIMAEFEFLRAPEGQEHETTSAYDSAEEETMG
ncbi:hypothetical protein Poli38472_004191 [Pythium oligandrum]|uniref:Endonuclease/exonuclease/phosphatase domain-containing protein n=1 Tax=Pythium oligandrum TaxID=41045 RepID=A0A8K1CMM2_PYTOL|nr:hypothetical protein Poli38472_004191 [Pythium oligandrum]|eukprot:TMW66426.1 hypothetical protein Poli38472_004191 [Pythium oligandrum]